MTLSAAAAPTTARTHQLVPKGRPQTEHTVVPWGPTESDVNLARARPASDAVKRELANANFREVGFEYIYDSTETKTQASRPPTRFRIVYYNYTTDQALFAEGNFAGTEPVSARWVDTVPGVGENELAAAYQLAEHDTGISKMRKGGTAQFYAAMPPTTIVDGERLVNIGIMDPKTGENSIVGVSFKTGRVIRYEDNAPPTAAATPDACGIPNAGQNPTGPGVAGQSTLTVNDGSGSPLWEMLIIRPSSSSGNSFERSGLEIRDVKYKGKSVLKRGHVPVLNVKSPRRGRFVTVSIQRYFNAPDAGAQPRGGLRILAPGQIATQSIERATIRAISRRRHL